MTDRQGFYDYDKDGSDRYLDDNTSKATSRTHAGRPIDYTRPVHHQGQPPCHPSILSRPMQEIHLGPTRALYRCVNVFQAIGALEADNLAAHRKTHDKPCWGNEEDASGARPETENEDDLDQDMQGQDSRLSKGYASDNSIAKKRRRFQADRGVESMSERESVSGHSSGEDEDDGAMMNLMELSSLNQEQHQKLHFQPQRNGQANVGVRCMVCIHLCNSNIRRLLKCIRSLHKLEQLCTRKWPRAFMPGLGGMATSAAACQLLAPFASGPLSATFGMFWPQAIPAPLFTLEEQENEDDENEEITDMEKLRYEYEIKSAIVQQSGRGTKSLKWDNRPVDDLSSLTLTWPTDQVSSTVESSKKFQSIQYGLRKDAQSQMDDAQARITQEHERCLKDLSKVPATDKTQSIKVLLALAESLQMSLTGFLGDSSAGSSYAESFAAVSNILMLVLREVMESMDTAGHFIGEFRMAMQESRCPEFGVEVEGKNHGLLATNQRDLDLENIFVD
ncbi:hypothetical protein BG004_003892 [Podila humilis]|nr:hypothetical protein BG004_003892 [Podila humilis]